jgi:hypothetical protein
MEAFLSGLVLTTLLSSLKGFFLSELLSEGRLYLLTRLSFALKMNSCRKSQDFIFPTMTLQCERLTFYCYFETNPDFLEEQ